ncbi:MAG: hypothetical protein R3A79_03960 [Nannocystaceae bacterium]
MSTHTRLFSRLAILHLCACSGPASDGPEGATEGSTTSSGCAFECAETGTTAGEDSTTTAGEDSTTTGEDATTGDPAPACEALPGAPPPFAIDGVAHVPLDLREVAAELVFDAASQEIRGAAVVDFRAGDVVGRPLFDLRQPITRAVLDGEELALAALVRVEPPAEDATMIAVDRLLEPCSEHVLELEYAVEALDTAPSFIFEPDAITWGTLIFDYPARRLAEKWLPSNLIHDVYDLSVELVVENAAITHALLANAPVAELGLNHWQVSFADATAMSPLLQLCPAGSVLREGAEVELGDATVEVVAWACTNWSNYAPDVAEIVPLVESALQYGYAELGPYPHGDRFLAVVLPATGPLSMEYPGATVTHTSDTLHEVFHTWIGRGVRPLTQRDAWFDETWTEYAADDAYMAEPIDPSGKPVALAGDNLWVRTFPTAAYTAGPRVLAGLAQAIGEDELRGLLREFYAAYTGEAVTTEILERDLHCRIGGDLVRQRFHRFVYGRTGDAPPAPAGYCEDARI